MGLRTADTIPRNNIPLNLMYIASNLKRNKIPVKILDLNLLAIKRFGIKKYSSLVKPLIKKEASAILDFIHDPKPLVDFIVSELEEEINQEDYTLIGVNGDYPIFAHFILQKVRKIKPEIKTIVGGHTATFYYESFITSPNVDYVFVGEAEDSFIKLAQSLCKKDLIFINNLIFKKNNSIIKTEIQKCNPKLEKIFYDFDFVKDYYDIFGSIDIIISKGCDNKCLFCNRNFNTCIKYMDREDIFDSIKFLNKEMGIKKIYFLDNYLNTPQGHLKALCEYIIKNNLDFKWGCFARLKNLDAETIHLMKKAGCYMVSFGIESGSEKILKFLNKNISLKEAETIIKACKKEGIKTRGSFIYNIPGETYKDIYLSLKLLFKLRLHYFRFGNLIYAPGASLYENPCEDYFIRYEDRIRFTGTRKKILNETVKKIFFKLLNSVTMFREFKDRTIGEN